MEPHVSEASHHANKQIRWLLYNKKHLLQHCGKLKTMPYSQMHDIIKRLQSWFNCLQTRHSVKKCTCSSCRKCGSKHHTILHWENNNNQLQAPESTYALSQLVPSVPAVHSCVSGAKISTGNFAILTTALIYLEDKFGITHDCNALIDVGS